MSLPTSRDVTMLADSLTNAAAWIRQHGEAALDARPADLVAAGRARAESAGPVAGGDRSDPTGSAVAGQVDREMAAIAALTELQTELRHAMADALDHGHRVVDAIARIQRVTTTPKRPEKYTPAVCCERYCEDPADPKRAGRCEPCSRWRRRWSEAHPNEVPPGVPRDVIDARVALRENRKVRVSGPTTSFV